MASLTLALHGENVDRAFWGIGSGGVGQSLQTAHLEALLGNYHACLDMNIYYVDEEMRKQAARLVGKIVVTGQETVQGSRKSMREDIYKKHISADKVPERLPYAIDTALVELRGWKRFEMNAYPRFVGVTEENLPSIFRRTAVCRYKATFVEPSKILAREEAAAERGIFARDPTLKDALRDNPACVVTLRSVCNYARQNSAAACRETLENYAVHGGDGGLTRLAVRTSCGLAVEEKDAADHVEDVLAAPEPPVPVDEVQRAKEARLREHNQYVKDIKEWLVQEHKDFFTAAQVRSAKASASFSFSRKDADTVLEKLAEDGHLLSESTVLPKAGLTTIYLPRIPAKKALGDVDLKLTENGSDGKLGEDLARRAEQEGELFEEIKSLAESGEVDADGLVTVQRQYFYPRQVRSRRIAKQRGAQTCSRLARAICCPHGRDVDVRASMFTVVVQLVEALSVPDMDISAWRAVAADRQKVCVERLSCSEAEGKQLLLEIANGAAVSQASRLQGGAATFLQQLSDESRELRWLACSQLPALYKEQRNQKSNWPESTVFAYWWTAAEDYVLQHILHGVQRHYLPGHISCHFDGVLLSQSLMRAVEEKVEEDILKYLQEQVSRGTPFQIKLKDKTVSSFQDALKKAFQNISDIACFGEFTDLLKAIPNSIPAALVFVGFDLRRVVSVLQAESPANTAADRRKVRQYSDWHGVDTKYLLPAGKLGELRQKNCILHIELPDESHCMGIQVFADNAITVCCQGKSFQTTWRALIQVTEAFVGSTETMLFEVVDKDPELDDADVGLLDLLAGSSSTPSAPLSRASRKRPSASVSAEPAEAPQNEGEVAVGDELKTLMRQEVEEALGLVESQGNSTFTVAVCPCCPWRRFNKRAHLRQHLVSQHTAAKRYCPSGTKQLRIAAALYDHDAVAGTTIQTGFLSRSAAIMRADVKPPVPTTIVSIDKTVRYVFDADGPIIMALHSVKKRNDLRRVGNLYYTYAFACAFLQAAATGNASLQRIYSVMVGACTRHRGQLSSLLPRATNGFWTNVLEDLMQAPPVQQFRDGLLDECREHNEFRYLSVDATFKINLKVIGQADFHSSQSSRDNAPIPEAEAGYRTLTCRGRTGAAVLIRVVRSEKAVVLAETLAKTLPLQQRSQVLHVASDSPSAEMFRVLQGVLPRLASIALDAMHIVMVYQQNMNNKKTQGSRWLAVLMDKFRKRDPVRSAASWGRLYTGDSLPPSRADVRSMRERLENPDMSAQEAYDHLKGVDPDQPWLTEVDFLQALLALLSIFYDEVQKVTFSGVTLHRLIINVASPAKVQWLLNDTRYRHSVDRESLVLLPSGTTSNESLHHELNHWFRETETWLQWPRATWSIGVCV
ncbi:unnamed protein product [Symbiodinium natans]|uniref:Uncharacterized protein n=1 Tax=Symbiodinium natans TaxID=878477 RepID=A0A812TG22_9DINO|nr:unnamed protein product [Symbiodinium natans]